MCSVRSHAARVTHVAFVRDHSVAPAPSLISQQWRTIQFWEIFVLHSLQSLAAWQVFVLTATFPSAFLSNKEKTWWNASVKSCFPSRTYLKLKNLLAMSWIVALKREDIILDLSSCRTCGWTRVRTEPTKIPKTVCRSICEYFGITKR